MSLSMAIVAFVSSGVTESTTSNTTGSTLVIILVAILGSGIITTLIVSYRDRQLGPVRIKEMEEHAADLAVHKLEAALRQSEKDLTRALARIELMEQQIRDLTLRIIQLEAELATSNAVRGDLQRDLTRVQRERDQLIGRVEALQAQIGGRRQGEV